MLLAIDIGNSSAKVGLFERERLVSTFRVGPGNSDSAGRIAGFIAENSGSEISGSVISSVVPDRLQLFADAAGSLSATAPLIADHSMDFGFRIDYVPVEDCGLDRLLAASAAVERAGYPCIVCDFGTAATIDLVDRTRTYRGGTISPGIGALYRSLHGDTAKLPLLEPAGSESVIGNSTRSAIASGVYFGFAGLVDGIIGRMLDEMGEDVPVIATGGDAPLVSGVSRYVGKPLRHLVLEGLFLLDKRNRPRR